MSFKKILNLFVFIFFFFWQTSAKAADLMEVFVQAQKSDPIFQQAISQRFATKEGVPIALSTLLPNIVGTLNPTLTRTGYSGTNYQRTVRFAPNFLQPRNNLQRGYVMALTVTQTVFNFGQYANLAGALANAHAADATLNSALQNLMLRVAAAYFAVLQDEDNLSYSAATKEAFAKQLDQARQQYKVGIKTLTDVYTAQASYDTADANYIGVKTTLANDRENLRVITGVYYPKLAKLSEDFPLISPKPNDVEQWVKTALLQNWSIRSNQYFVEAAREMIHLQFAGHLPVLNAQAAMNRVYTENKNGYNTFNIRNGPGTITNRGIELNLTVPIFSGGGVVAATNQATYQFEVAQQQLEQVIRSTINTTRQSYQTIIAGISKIKADKEAIKSTISSLEGLEASYQVGTETLVDVVIQRQKVFQAQTQYAADRYAFVNNILMLKAAAGILDFDDLRALNTWLLETK